MRLQRPTQCPAQETQMKQWFLKSIIGQGRRREGRGAGQRQLHWIKGLKCFDENGILESSFYYSRGAMRLVCQRTLEGKTFFDKTPEYEADKRRVGSRHTTHYSHEPPRRRTERSQEVGNVEGAKLQTNPQEIQLYMKAFQSLGQTQNGVHRQSISLSTLLIKSPDAVILTQLLCTTL